MKIELDHISKTIKGADVLVDISMILHSGSIIGFRGVNGSGKTMLMRAIAGLIRPTKGTVTIDGKVLGKDISFPPSVGALIENPAFLEGYSGFENLRILASIRNRVAGAEIKETMTKMGLAPESKKAYKKYSLGMKQRLGIAAAIMEQPELILLDEPTNALDVDGVEIVKEVLQKEKRRGALIILCCHDTEVLESMADEIYHIQEGRLTTHTVRRNEV